MITDYEDVIDKGSVSILIEDEESDQEQLSTSHKNIPRASKTQILPAFKEKMY